MTNTESKQIDAVRVTSNYLVVFIHAWAASQYCPGAGAEGRFWDVFCNIICNTAMPALFLMSGYLLMMNFTPAQFGAKILRRVKRLAIPFLVWNFLFVAFYLVAASCVPRLATRVSAFGLTTVSGVMDKTLSFLIPPIDTPTWFLKPLFLYSLFAVPLALLLRSRIGRVLVWLLPIGLVALSAANGGAIGGRLIFAYPAYSLAAFVLGAFLVTVGRSPFTLFRSPLWMIVSVAGFVLFNHFSSTHQCWEYTILRDISVLMITPFLFTLAPRLVTLGDRIPCFEFLKRSAFFLYCGHFLFNSMVLHLTAPLVAGWTGPGKLTVLVFVFAVPGTAICLLAYALGRKLFGRALAPWDGTL